MRLALDIGYSNVKGLYGQSAATPGILRMLAGAGPADKAVRTLPVNHAPGVRVRIDGREWIAGVEHSRFPDLPRVMDESYAESVPYLALYHAALSITDADVVERIVTGLPITQYLNKEARVRLRARLSGRHRVNKRSVEVREVIVIPQAVGAFLDYAARGRFRDVAEHGRVLVMDAGYYSVDWALVVDGEWQPAASGASGHAFSSILEAAAENIYSTRRARVTSERIERAMRESDADLVIHGDGVSMGDFCGSAIEKVAPVALAELARKLRSEIETIDLVVLGGGGATSYVATVRQTFPHAKVDICTDPVIANARGYWSLSW